MRDKYPRITEMNQVTPDHAEEYIHLLQKSGRHDKTISYSRGKKDITHTKSPESMAAATINDYIMLLKMVFNSLKKKAGIQQNPFIEIPMLIRNSESREAFTIEELKLIGEKAGIHICILCLSLAFVRACERAIFAHCETGKLT